MSEVYLTVSEMAEIKGCTVHNVRDLIRRDKLNAIEVSGYDSGRGGLQYRIPLSALDKKLQVKYKRQQIKAVEAVIEDDLPFEDEAEPLDYEFITAAERKQIVFWKGIIKEWDGFRSTSPLNKAEADNHFIELMAVKYPDLSLSYRSLSRKRKDFYAKGEAALIDRRGKHGKHDKKMTEEMFNVFEFYYLDDTQKTVSLCRFLTGQELKRLYGDGQELPSMGTFNRWAINIPIPYVKYFREGKEAFMSECAPYIRRMYEDLRPNDIWVADGRTFDVMVLGRDGKPFRPQLSAFMDVRSRKFMGWAVTDKLCGDATIYALKRGVEVYGVPGAIQSDNGREYLFHDFGGDAGFRKKAKPKEGEFKPPTIIEALGIEMRVSLPKNARAKAIERAFDTVKETFDKLFEGYTGGNVLEKPDSLKDVLKQPDKLITIDEFIQCVDTYIKGFYNKQPHRGAGMNGRSPDEVFAALLEEKRVVPKDMLNLMFMRYSKGTMKVGKNGVTLKIYGETLQYSDKGLWEQYFGREVYVRYSPDDLSSVRVYNTDNQFICEAKLEGATSYNATKEERQAINREKKSQVKAVKNYKKVKAVQAQDALDAILDKASENLELPENIDVSILRIIQSGEVLAQPLQKAAGAEELEPIDWNSAIERLKLFK